MECLEGIQSCLTSAQGTYAGYEEICNSFDEEEYKKALAQYQIDYEEWEKSKEDEEE